MSACPRIHRWSQAVAPYCVFHGHAAQQPDGAKVCRLSRIMSSCPALRGTVAPLTLREAHTSSSATAASSAHTDEDCRTYNNAKGRQRQGCPNIR